MAYLNLIIGIVTVLVTAGFAVYMSQPTDQTEPPHQRRRNEERGANNGGRPKNNFENQRVRTSKPGDLCPLCQSEMSSYNMHRMQCGHALHNDCFQEFRYLRRSCLLCNHIVNPSLPGDQCTICLDPLTKKNMKHLPCQHAMHNDCFSQYRASGATNCPLCRSSF
ncbi:zinc finger protein BRUTUS-like At1g18910 [Drosophila miranda]|uniref:zinc finger protein BRUTUS-like At1g18910 n=1 Tax=Drosophila miranda TaxID=7229 RepID=UPI0007E7E70B|nr:zinc finger protein BRUTUS-like At1g18910 [Drosophila miranda]